MSLGGHINIANHAREEMTDSSLHRPTRSISSVLNQLPFTSDRKRQQPLCGATRHVFNARLQYTAVAAAYGWYAMRRKIAQLPFSNGILAL